MKKFLLALTFAVLISAYPALRFVLINELDNPNVMTNDGTTNFTNLGFFAYREVKKPKSNPLE